MPRLGRLGGLRTAGSAGVRTPGAIGAAYPALLKPRRRLALLRLSACLLAGSLAHLVGARRCSGLGGRQLGPVFVVNAIKGGLAFAARSDDGLELLDPVHQGLKLPGRLSQPRGQCGTVLHARGGRQVQALDPLQQSQLVAQVLVGLGGGVLQLRSQIGHLHPQRVVLALLLPQRAHHAADRGLACARSAGGGQMGGGAKAGSCCCCIGCCTAFRTPILC